MRGLANWLNLLNNRGIKRVSMEDFVDRRGVFARFVFGGTPDVREERMRFGEGSQPERFPEAVFVNKQVHRK